MFGTDLNLVPQVAKVIDNECHCAVNSKGCLYVINRAFGTWSDLCVKL